MRTRSILMLICAGSLVSGIALAGDAPTASGLRVYVDPDTGEITEPPAAAPRAAEDPADVAADDLAEEPATGVAGGTKIDLRGRFRSEARATVHADGSVQKDCVVDRGAGE